MENPCKRSVFDPDEPDEYAESNIDADWTNFSGDIVKEDPPNILVPLVKLVMITVLMPTMLETLL